MTVNVSVSPTPRNFDTASSVVVPPGNLLLAEDGTQLLAEDGTPLVTEE